MKSRDMFKDDGPILKAPRRKRLPVPVNAEYSDSGKYRRRGPRNRFSTQADRDSEVDRIIALKTAGLCTDDIAEALRMSRATVYRRIDSIKDRVPAPTPTQQVAREARAAALLALWGADTARAHELAVARAQKREKRHSGQLLAQDEVALEAIRLAADLHKAELEYLRHLGVFDAIRKEGRGLEFLAFVRSASQQLPAASGD